MRHQTAAAVGFVWALLAVLISCQPYETNLPRAVIRDKFVTRTRVDGELQSNLTITGDVYNPPLFSLAHGPVRLDASSDNENYTIEIFVPGSLIKTRLVPFELLPELSQQVLYTHCDGTGAMQPEPQDMLTPPTLFDQENNFLQLDDQIVTPAPPPESLIPVSGGDDIFFGGRRLLASSSDDVLTPTDEPLEFGSDQPVSTTTVLRVANVPCENSPTTSYAVRARANCFNQVVQKCINVGASQCPWATVGTGQGTVYEQFYGEPSRNKCNRQLVAPPASFAPAVGAFMVAPPAPLPRNLPLAVATDAENKAKIVPTAFCEFAPRDTQGRTVNTQGDKCQPLCSTCSPADLAAINAMTPSQFRAAQSGKAAEMKAQAGVRYIDVNGIPQTSDVYFETPVGQECFCAPRTEQAFRTCALNPWVEPDMTGQVQKCVKAFSGFICLPVRLTSLKRNLAPERSLTSQCGSPSGLIKVVLTVAYGVQGRGIPCNRATVAVSDGRALAYEIAEQTATLSDNGVELNDLIHALRNDSQATINFRLQAATTLSSLINSTNVRNNQAAYIKATFAMIEKDLQLSVNRSIMLRTALQAQDQITSAGFNQSNSILATLISNLAAFEASGQAATNFTAQQITLLQQDTGLDELSMLRLGRLIAATESQADIAMDTLVSFVQGREKYAAVAAGVYKALQRTKEQTGLVPLVSNYTRPQPVLPAALRSFLMDVQLTYGFVGTQLVQHEMQLECTTANMLQLNAVSMSTQTVFGLIGPIGCNVSSELYAGVSCYCIVHTQQRSCQLIPTLATSVAVAAPAAFLQAVTSGKLHADRPLSNNSTNGGLCVNGTVQTENSTTYDDLDLLQGELEGVCQNTSFVPTSNSMFQTFYTVSLGNQGSSVGSRGHPQCSLDPNTQLALFATTGQPVWLNVVLQMWLTALQQRLGSQLFAQLDALTRGGRPQMGLTFRAYAYGRPPDDLINQAQPPVSSEFVPDPQTDAERTEYLRDQIALLAPLYNLTVEQWLNATGVDELHRLLGLPDGYSAIQNATTRLAPQNCIDVSYLATGLFAMPAFLTTLDSVTLDVHARIVPRRPLTGPVVNATNTVERTLNNDLLGRNYSAAVVDETMDFGQMFTVPYIWFGYPGCALGDTACRVPRSSVASLFENNTEFYMYDPSNNDQHQGGGSLPTYSGTVQYAHLSLNESMALLGDGCPPPAPPDEPLSCPNATNPAFLFNNLTQLDACLVFRYYGAGCRIPMFLIDHLFQQQGLDPNLPQSSTLGFNPLNAAVNPDTIRVPLIRQKITQLDALGNLQTTLQLKCNKEDARKNLWCQRLEHAAIRTDPELYDGETNPDRWRWLVWTPYEEVISFSIQLPVLEVARYQQAIVRRTCPYAVSLDRGRNATEWVLRIIPPAFNDTLLMTLQMSSELGVEEMFDCDGQNRTLVFLANDTSLYREFVIPNCHILHLQLFSGDGTTCWTTDASALVANLVNGTDTDNQQDAAVDVTFDESENRYVVALQSVSMQLGELIRATRQAFNDEVQRGVLLPVTPSSPLPPSLDAPRTAAELAAIDQLPDQLVNASLVPAWQLNNDTALSDLIAQVEQTLDARLREIQANNRSELAVIVLQEQINAQAAQSAAAYEQAIIRDTQALVTLQFLEPLVAAYATGNWDNVTEAGWDCLAAMGAVVTNNPQAAARIAAIRAYRMNVRTWESEDTTLVPSNPFSYLNPSMGGSLAWLRAIVWSLIWSVIFDALFFLFICVKPLQCCECMERMRKWTLWTCPACCRCCISKEDQATLEDMFGSLDNASTTKPLPIAAAASETKRSGSHTTTPTTLTLNKNNDGGGGGGSDADDDDLIDLSRRMANDGDD